MKSNPTDKIHLSLEDRMILMARYPDNYFDLALVDPEYGIGADKPSKKKKRVLQKNGQYLNIEQKIYTHKNWDAKPPDKKYFDELIRVSRNQIIFGCNYFDYPLTGGRIIWDKLNGLSDQFDCEIAYNSLNMRTDIVYYMWHGMMQGAIASRNIKEANKQQGNKKLNEKRIHPAQKPVKLLKWMLNEYAKPGFKILDTGFGSASIAIACYDLDLDLTACEIDPQIFHDGLNRTLMHIQQTKLF